MIFQNCLKFHSPNGSWNYVLHNNLEISLVVFMPNITTNHAITHTNLIHFKKYRKLEQAGKKTCNLHGKPKHLGSRDSSYLYLVFLHFSNIYLWPFNMLLSLQMIMTLLLVKAIVNSIVFPKTVFTSAVHMYTPISPIQYWVKTKQ